LAPHIEREGGPVTNRAADGTDDEYEEEYEQAMAHLRSA
jgi:hypothetical protein